MDERKITDINITDMVACLFASCSNAEEVYELESLLENLAKKGK